MPATADRKKPLKIPKPERHRFTLPPLETGPFAGDDEPLIELVADFDQNGVFGARLLRISATSVRVTEEDGRVSLEIPIAEIKSARNEPLIGGGRLEVTFKSGAMVPVVTYSMNEAAKFSEAARGLEQLAEGKPLSINLTKEKTRCVKCGRLLPEKDGICPACMNRNRTLLRVAGYLKPYRAQSVALAVLTIVTTAINLVPPYLQGTLVDKVLSPHHDLRLLPALMAVWLVVLAVGVALQVVNSRLTAWLAAQIAADLRSAVYRSVEFLRLSYFDKKQVGSITSRITQDTERVWGFLAQGMPFLISNALLVLGITGFLFVLNWKLALAVMAPVPLSAFCAIFFWNPMTQLFHRYGQRWSRFHMYLNEALSGIRVVKAFAQEDLENAKFNAHNVSLRDAGIRVDCYWANVFGLMSFCTALGGLINWFVGGYFVYTGEMTLGNFWKATAYLALVYGPMQWFAQVNNWFSRAMAGAERIFEVMDAEPENYAQAKGTPEISGTVRFDNVRFGYDKSNPVLKNLSFTAKPGDFIGLVGKSGAGKSTTINLICRFYEPDAGTIWVDGHDYRDLDLQHWRRSIGMVLQEPFLFNGTIADNIAYGKPDASFAEIVEAAKAANAHHFVLAKADGYDTVVGERGAKLSGGERQRISIARAILHDPKILILDEATASVDVETEKQIQGAMARLIAGRTTFAIAHRLATLRNATRLVVLEKGQIVETGTHAELMALEGEFYKLVKTQTEINEIVGAIA